MTTTVIRLATSCSPKLRSGSATRLKKVGQPVGASVATNFVSWPTSTSIGRELHAPSGSQSLLGTPSSVSAEALAFLLSSLVQTETSKRYSGPLTEACST